MQQITALPTTPGNHRAPHFLRALGAGTLALLVAACGSSGGDTGEGGGNPGNPGNPNVPGNPWNPNGGPGAPTGPGNYRLANLSADDQTRWTRLMVPAEVADALPDLCEYDYGSGTATAVKGRSSGPMCQVFHVRGDAAGYGTSSGALEGVGPMPMQSFQFSNWVLDAPQKMDVFLHAVRGGQRTSMQFQLASTVDSSPFVRTDRYVASPVGGVWGELFLTFYDDQDVVDLEGRFGWSDHDDPAWFTHFESIELTMGEELVLYFASRSGFRPIAGGWQLFSDAARDGGKFPHGMAPHFYGVILPRPDPMPAQPSAAEQARLDLLDAAREGPLLMVGDASVWETRWFAFGEVPKVPPGVDPIAEADRSAAGFRSYLGGTGEIWDERPLANRFSTGTTGAQAPFGATKGTLAVTVGDPRFVWEMLYSSTDYGLRTFHHRERDGSRVLAANRPEWICNNGVADPRFSRDLLGKDPTRSYSWNLGRHGPDGQHRGQNYMWAALALTGSWVLHEVALDLIQVDSTRPGPGTNPSAPRGLRTQQDYVKIYCVMPDPQAREHLVQLMDWSLETWELGWSGGSVSGPVRPMDASRPDARVLCCGLEFWVPWNEALGVMGLLECRALMRKIGRTDLQQRYEAFILPVARTMLLYGTARDSNGVLLPLNGVAWLADGQPQPPAYYNLNRPGASTRQGEGVDMLVGTPGWYWWWSGVVHATLFLASPASPEFLLADEIRRSFLVPERIDKAEWIAVGWN